MWENMSSNKLQNTHHKQYGLEKRKTAYFKEQGNGHIEREKVDMWTKLPDK